MDPRQQLNEIRESTGWTQELIARRLGVTFVTLNSWLHGRSLPRKQAAARIDALHGEVTTGDLDDTEDNVSALAGLHVFFTTPYAGKARYQRYIDAILQELERDCSVTTPEDTTAYIRSLHDLQQQGLDHDQAHYAFIRQGIASADVVVIEATEEDLRVGHEMTLALLFHKPTLILSRQQDYSNFITHDLLTGASYDTAKEAAAIVRTFLTSSQTCRTEASMQTFDTSADSLHSRALASLRRLAKQEPGQFGEWSRQAERDPQAVAEDIGKALGGLEQQPAWSVFAPVYNEDSPDYIQSGVATFIDSVLTRYGIAKDAPIVEAACGTGALARLLAARGYADIAAFDNSRAMLAEAFRLCADLPAIRPFEADICSLRLQSPAKAIVWTDYSSNFALDDRQLADMLRNLLGNLADDGLLIFDVRTFNGWQIDFYSQPVTAFATERFQRLWLNHQDHDSKLISFDVFIRTRDLDGGWAAWRRESMRERMWRLHEVREIVSDLPEAHLEAVYGDDFRRLRDEAEEPNLAYLVIRKRSA